MTKTETQTQKIVARQITNYFNEKVWQFGTPSILNKGTTSYSIRVWSTKAAALRAGRREYGQV